MAKANSANPPNINTNPKLVDVAAIIPAITPINIDGINKININQPDLPMSCNLLAETAKEGTKVKIE